MEQVNISYMFETEINICKTKNVSVMFSDFREMRYTYPVIYYVPLMFDQFRDSPDNLFLWDYSCRNMIENVRNVIKDTVHQEKNNLRLIRLFTLHMFFKTCILQFLFRWTQKMIFKIIFSFSINEQLTVATSVKLQRTKTPWK